MLRRVLVVLAGVLVLGALGAGSAGAVPLYPFARQLAPASGSFGYLSSGSVAVDDFNGDTYVADTGSDVVNVFETATGAQLGGSIEGSSTPAGSFSGAIAVAANNGTGKVYVLDPGHGAVDVFEPSGAYACQITGSATPSASECNGVAGSKTPGAGGLLEPSGIAVDQATGDVYVVDAGYENPNPTVDVFSAGGEYLRQILLNAVPGGASGGNGSGIAVSDFNGHVYVASAGQGVVYEFDAAGNWVATWSGANTPAGSFHGEWISVAVDDASGYVYVSNAEHGTFVFDSSGAYLAQFSHFSAYGIGTTVDQATGKVYVSDDNAETYQHEVVQVFGPALVIPGVTTGEASGVSPTGATLSGTVNPAGVQLSDCRFEYGTDEFYGQSVPCVPAAGSIPADSSDHAVGVTLTGLEPGTTYHFRLRAANDECASCANFGEDATLATPPQPLIGGASAVNVMGGSADLRAQINPRGFDTTYRFEWGTSTAYGTSVPVPDGDLGAGSSGIAVSTHLSGLSTNTTYHWRVVAQNVNGIATGLDHTFVYSTGGAGLPDGRAYEMVTPQRKNGALVGDVQFGISPNIGEDGSHLVLATVQCFGEATSCPAQDDTPGTVYAFTRTSGGWTASPLAPPATQFAVNNVWLVSADAGTALFTMPTAPVGENDWYAREADGSFHDIGPTVPPSPANQGQQLSFSSSLRATADLSHVIYNADARWPFDATLNGINNSLYEDVGLDNTAPVLVGVSGGRGSTDLLSECGTYFGSDEDSPDALSADGRTVFFTAIACASGSCVNAGVQVPRDELFARIDESRTVSLAARSPLACTAGSGCLESPVGAARFVGASANGSRAFFLDTQQLTDNASEDSQGGDTAYGFGCSETVGVNGCNLYEYDFANPAGRNLLAVSAGDTSGDGPRVQGVVAVSADGSHVYFVAKGVLTGIANDQGVTARGGAENLYVFERDANHPAGQIAFVASLLGTDSKDWGSLSSANVTPDGRFLVFTSRGALTVDDSSSTGARQVFRYDAQTGRLVRISIGEGGFNDDGNAGVGDARIVPHELYSRLGPVRTDPTMSSDGSYVFFESPVALTPGALDDVQISAEEAATGRPGYAENVYEYHEGHVYLLSDGRDVSRSLSTPCEDHESSVCLLGTDASGRNVFFTTADPLSPQDGDSAVDVYDARVCTQSDPCIAPAVSGPAACQGDACHGASGVTPPVLGPGTVAFSGPGNLVPAAPSVVKAKAKKKHTQRAHGKPKAKKKARKHRPKRRAGRSSKRHGHTSRAGGK